MSDYNGNPLILRDDVEREFWGSVYAAEWNRGVQSERAAFALTRGDYADAAVVEMRVRQKFAQILQAPNERFPTEHTARGCAVCAAVAPYENRVYGEIKHAGGCPLGALT